MTAFALQPTFVDQAGYSKWLRGWRTIYNRITRELHEKKAEIRAAQRSGSPEAPGQQRKLRQHQVVAFKLMTLHESAVHRWENILKMHADLAEQNASFPLDLGACDRVDFHFNKGSIEWDFLPMWTIRAKGKSYYVKEVEANVAWTTKERASGTTKGVIRIKKCRVYIDGEGNAILS